MSDFKDRYPVNTQRLNFVLSSVIVIPIRAEETFKCYFPSYYSHRSSTLKGYSGNWTKLQVHSSFCLVLRFRIKIQSFNYNYLRETAEVTVFCIIFTCWVRPRRMYKFAYQAFRTKFNFCFTTNVSSADVDNSCIKLTQLGINFPPPASVNDW